MSEGLSINSVLNLDVRKATEQARKFASKPLKLNLIIPTDDIFKEFNRQAIKPIKVKIDRTEIDQAIASLERLNDTIRVSSSKISASIDTRVNHIVKFDTLKYDSIVSKTVRDSGRELKRELQYLNKNVRQLRPNKLASLLGFIGKTATAPVRLAGNVGGSALKNVFTGFTENIGRQLSGNITKSFSKDLSNFVKQKSTQFEKLIDVTFKDLLNFPGGLKQANNLAFKNVETLVNNVTDVNFYKDLEDLFIDFTNAFRNQSFGKNLSESQKADKRLFEESRQKVVDRFSEVIGEDLVRVAGALIKIMSQPIRIRKRINLNESAEIAKNQQELFAKEYQDSILQQQVKQKEGYTILVGGTAPNESKPGQPAIQTTSRIGSMVQGLFPNSIIEQLPPYETVSVENLEKGMYHQSVREKLLPWIKENKQLLLNYINQELYDNLIANLNQFHPLEGLISQNIDKGYNLDARKLATKALSSALAFPDKSISLTGASGGTYIVEEAIAILNETAKRYPELADAVKRVKGLGIGGPITGLTQTSKTGDISKDLASFVSFIGDLDHVGKGFFGNTFVNKDLDPNDPKYKFLIDQIGLPGGILNPDPNLQRVIPDWGYKHEVGKMYPDLLGSPNAVNLLASDFFNNQGKLTVPQSQSLESIFPQLNQIESILKTNGINEYIDNIQNIIKTVAKIQKDTGSKVDTKLLGKILGDLKYLQKTGIQKENLESTAPTIQSILSQSIYSGLGLEQLGGLGSRDPKGRGKQSFSAGSVHELLRNIVNTLYTLQGRDRVFKEDNVDLFDPLIKDIKALEQNLAKSAQELNLPAGNTNSLIQLWTSKITEIPPVRKYADEFQDNWSNFLKELNRLEEISGKKYIDKEAGKQEEMASFLWDTAGISIMYRDQPSYQEMMGKYQEKKYSTPIEKQQEKALLAFFDLLEKDANIFKRDYLQPLLEAQQKLQAGDETAYKDIEKIMLESPFSKVKGFLDNANKPIVKGSKRFQSLGESANYDQLNNFINSFKRLLLSGDVSQESVASVTKSGFGVSPEFDNLLLGLLNGQTPNISYGINANDIEKITQQNKGKSIEEQRQLVKQADDKITQAIDSSEGLMRSLSDVYAELGLIVKVKQEKLSNTLRDEIEEIEESLNKTIDNVKAINKSKQIGIRNIPIKDDFAPRSILIEDEPKSVNLPVKFQDKVGEIVKASVANKVNEKLLINAQGDVTPDKGQIVKLSDLSPMQTVAIAIRDIQESAMIVSKGAAALNQGFNQAVSILTPVVSSLYKLDQGAKGFIKALDPTGLSGIAIKGAETLMPAAAFSMVAGGTPAGQALGGAVGSVVHPLLGAGGEAIASGLSGSLGSSLTSVPLVGNQIGAAFNQGILEATGTVVNALSGISTDIVANVLGGQALKTLATKALNPVNEEKLRALPQATQEVVNHAVSMGNAMRREANKLLASSSPQDARKAIQAINSYLELTYLALQEAKLETKALPGSRKKGSLYNETKYLQGELTKDLNKIKTVYPDIVDVDTPEFSVSKQALDAYEKEALRVSIRVREILEKGGDLSKVPNNILEGFRIGLKNGEGRLTKTAVALGKILPTEINKILGIASPSKWAINTMKFIAKGFEIGSPAIAKSLNQVASDVEKRINQIKARQRLDRNQSRVGAVNTSNDIDQTRNTLIGRIKQGAIARQELLRIKQQEKAIQERFLELELQSINASRKGREFIDQEYKSLKETLRVNKLKTGELKQQLTSGKKSQIQIQQLAALEERLRLARLSGDSQRIKATIRQVQGLRQVINQGNVARDFLGNIRQLINTVAGDFISKLPPAIKKVTGLIKGMGAAIAGYLASTVFNAYDIFFRLQYGIRRVITTGIELESVEVLLNNVGLSFDEASEKAIKFATNIKESAKGYAQLATATQDSPLEGKETEKIYDSLLQASRAYNLSAEETNGVLLAMRQILSDSVLQMQDFNQLAERVPGIINIASRAMNVAVTDFRKLNSEGVFSSQEFAQNLANQLALETQNKVGNSLNTTQANIEKFRNELQLLEKALFGNFSGGFNVAVKGLTQMMSVAVPLIPIIGSLGKGLALIGAIALIQKIPTIIGFFQNLGINAPLVASALNGASAQAGRFFSMFEINLPRMATEIKTGLIDGIANLQFSFVGLRNAAGNTLATIRVGLAKVGTAIIGVVNALGPLAIVGVGIDAITKLWRENKAATKNAEDAIKDYMESYKQLLEISNNPEDQKTSIQLNKEQFEEDLSLYTKISDPFVAAFSVVSNSVKNLPKLIDLSAWNRAGNQAGRAFGKPIEQTLKEIFDETTDYFSQNTRTARLIRGEIIERQKAQEEVNKTYLKFNQIRQKIKEGDVVDSEEVSETIVLLEQRNQTLKEAKPLTDVERGDIQSERNDIKSLLDFFREYQVALEGFSSSYSDVVVERKKATDAATDYEVQALQTLEEKYLQGLTNQSQYELEKQRITRDRINAELTAEENALARLKQNAAESVKFKLDEQLAKARLENDTPLINDLERKRQELNQAIAENDTDALSSYGDNAVIEEMEASEEKITEINKKAVIERLKYSKLEKDTKIEDAQKTAEAKINLNEQEQTLDLLELEKEGIIGKEQVEQAKEALTLERLETELEAEEEKLKEIASLNDKESQEYQQQLQARNTKEIELLNAQISAKQKALENELNLTEQARLIEILKLEQQGVISKQEAEKLKGQATLDRIKTELQAEQKKLQAIAQLYGQDSQEHSQQLEAVNAKTIELLNAEIQAQQTLGNVIQSVVDKSIENRKRELDVIRTQLDLINKVNDKIKELEESRFSFTQTASEGETKLAELRIKQLKRALEIRRQLTSEEADDLSLEQRGVLLQELASLGISGRQDEKSILEEIGRIQQKNAQRELQLLKQEFEFKERILALEIKQAEINAQQQVIDAKKALVEAKGKLNEADSDKEIRLAKDELKLAKDQLQIAYDSQNALKEINDLKEQQLETEKAIALQTEKSNQSTQEYSTRGEIAEANRDEIAILKEQEKQRIKEARDKAKGDKDARSNLKDTIAQIRQETQEGIDRIKEERRRGDNIVTPVIKPEAIAVPVSSGPVHRPSVIQSGGTRNAGIMSDLKGVRQDLNTLINEVKNMKKPNVNTTINVPERDFSDMIRTVGNRVDDVLKRNLNYGY